MIVRIGLLLILSATTARADKYEKFFRDFIAIRAWTEACLDAAQTHAEVVACAGQATEACKDPDSDWPHPEPRDCRNEADVWERLYKLEALQMFELATSRDARDLVYDRSVYAQRQGLVMEAESSWQGYAGALCRREDAPWAEFPYKDRPHMSVSCMMRMYAGRIFYLRSEANWLSYYQR